MDARILAWGRRVKARGGAGGPPPLWLFTDPERMADPLAAIASLPRGLAGVVLRHDGTKQRAALGRAVARLCRARRLVLSVAGDWRLAARLHAGLHLRGGRLPSHAARWLPRLTASAHAPADVLRGRRAGVAVIFISPVFATASHPGGRKLGARRWAAWALGSGRSAAAALGGIEPGTVGRLPRACRAVGGIAAWRAGDA